MSATKSKASTDRVYHRPSKTCPSGSEEYHSESQLIADIKALWKTEPHLVVEPFISHAYKSRPRVIMSGLELYGSLDSCTACLRDLVEFRKENQNEAQGISRCIKDKMRDKHLAVKPENRFVVIYHARFPYSPNFGAYEKKSGQLYALKRSFTEFKEMEKGGDAYEKAEFENGDILSQAEEVAVGRDVIYGHLHSLSGRTAIYSKAITLNGEGEEVTGEDGSFAYKPS